MAPGKPSGLSPLVPVPWSGVRAWLDAAEATQAASGGSTAHVTPVQLLALSQLASFCGADEPDVSKQDHVSKLMHLSQARRLGAPPTFEMGDPIEVPFRGAFQLRWHCTCVLPWCGRRFPASSGDAEEPGRKPPPLFTNKKDAKQYAAMLAVAYLDSVTNEVTTSHTTPHTPTHPSPPPSVEQEKQLPPEQKPSQQTEQQQQQQQQAWPTQPTLTEPVAVQAPSSPAQHAPKQEVSHLPPFEPIPVPSPSPPHPQPPSSSPSPPPSPSQGTVTTIATAAAPSSPPRLKRPLDSPTTPTPTRRASPLKTDRAQRRRDAPSSPPPAPPVVPFVSPKGRGAEAAAEQSRLFTAIARVCRHLGVSQPQYRLTQDPDHPSFFSGHAEFSVGSRVPEGIAVASGVLGKRQARIHIAEQVLEWMEKEAARRQKLLDGMLM